MKTQHYGFSVHLALFTVSLIYAANYSIAQWAMPEFIGPFGFILLRVACGAAIFYLFYRLFAYEPIRERKHYLQLAIAGFFGVALNMLAFFKGLSLTSPINASVLMMFAPVFVVSFSILVGRRRGHWYTLLGLLLAFGGAAMLTGIRQFDLGSSGLKGDLLVILNACSYGYYLVYVFPLLTIYRPTTITAYIFLFGLIYVLPFGWGELASVSWSRLDGPAWQSVVYVVLAVTVAAYFLNSWGVQKSSSTLVGSYIYLQPILAAAIAILLGQDRLTAEKAIFAAVIIAGVYLVNLSKK